MASPNKDVVDILLAMAQVQKTKGEAFRASAYTKAANAVKRYPTRLQSGAEAETIPGIGNGIARRIHEILATGSLQELKGLQGDEVQKAIDLLQRVSGIGPVAARRFVCEDGVRTLKDLRGLEGKLNLQQRIGLKYLEEFEQRVPRSEVAEIAARVRDVVVGLDPRLYTEAVGSYRRGQAESGDIDILVTHPSEAAHDFIGQIVSRLEEVGLVTDVISKGAVQFTGVCRLSPSLPHRRLDIKLFPVACFPAALLHFTGSWEHNRLMRIAAQEQGYTLNEYGLYPIDKGGARGESIPLSSEADVFRALGMEYKDPSERNV